MEEMFGIERRGHVTVLSTSESLKAHTAPMMKNLVKELCREDRPKLVIDMRQIPSIDSAGCGVLVSSLRGVRISNGEIRIVGPNESIREVLKLTRLDSIFEIYQGLDEAIQSFSGAAMKL